MFIIDASGTLVYAGGIDDRASASASSLDGATNYVTAALADIAAGRAVAVSESEPYGCNVKYE
jgi:sensor domain CHASE-containing protein